MDDRIYEMMADCEKKHVTIKTKDGQILYGFVDVFESRYDNDGEASICFAGDKGEMLIIEEGEISSITSDED